jgi:hypothetical protein
MMLQAESHIAPETGTAAGTSMTAMRNPRGEEFECLNLVLFSVGGVFFGMDGDQVAGVSDYGTAVEADLLWFHEAIGYGKRSVEYRAPTIATIRTGQGPRRVIIDSMENIAEFRTDEIDLLPALLEPFALRRGIWGILPRGDNLVLLVDMDRLLGRKSCEEIETRFESGDGIANQINPFVLSRDAID